MEREDEAEILQQRLTGLRETTEAYPLIPVLKGLTRELRDEEVWLNTRPPLSEPSRDQARDLLCRLPVPALS
jgi:hypothetical protein